MSHLNFNFGVITYEDNSVTNPTVRSLDVTRTMIGIPVIGERTDRIEDLAPGESRVIASTLRTITADNTTEFDIVHPVSADSSTVRVVWNKNGTPAGFATKREIGTDDTSVISITRVNSATCRVSCVAGTAMNTASVQIGDNVRFEQSTDTFTSSFSYANQKTFRVLSKGVGYIDVLENGVMSEDQNVLLGSDFDSQMRVFSNGSVKINDFIEISGNGQNPNNIGKFQIIDVAYDYVQIVNPYAVDTSFTNSDNIKVYDRLMGFVFVRANNSVSVKINDGNAVKIQRLGSNEAMFIGSIQAFKIELVNEEQSSVSATVHYSSLA